MTRRCIVCALALLIAGCVRKPPAATAPPTLRAVAVFPPNNRTGDELLVEGGSLLEKYLFHVERVTVSDVLAAEARLQLAARGLNVIPPPEVDAAAGEHPPLSAATAAVAAARGHIEAAVLYIEIRAWEPNAPFEPNLIIVSLAVTLIDPSDGRILWTADHPARPIATPGVVSPAAADVIAAEKVMEELLAPFGPLLR